MYQTPKPIKCNKLPKINKIHQKPQQKSVKYNKIPQKNRKSTIKYPKKQQNSIKPNKTTPN